jgi:hypothetical protein
MAAGLWTPLAVGLWRRHATARTVALGVAWYMVVVIPLGTINPLAAVNDYGPNPPSVSELLLEIAPSMFFALLGIHVLGKYKGEFRNGSRAT